MMHVIHNLSLMS